MSAKSRFVLGTSGSLFLAACIDLSTPDMTVDRDASVSQNAADGASGPSDGAAAADGATDHKIPDAGGGSDTSPATAEPVPASGSADEDFRRRCAAPGVLKCLGFDSMDQITPGLTPDWQGMLQGSVDTGVKASGGGALKFTIPSYSAANTGGAFEAPMGKGFGENSTFYVQYRMRISPEMLANMGGGGWKQSIFHINGSTCGWMELATVNGYYGGLPGMYSGCGADPFATPLDNGDFLLQQGEYECHYQNRTASTCAYYKADQWMTFYYKVQIGTYLQPSSHVEAWIAFEGGPMKQFIDQVDHKLSYDIGPSDVYDYVALLPYDTGKDPNVYNPVAYMWFDELIISSGPIAAPGPSP